MLFWEEASVASFPFLRMPCIPKKHYTVENPKDEIVPCLETWPPAWGKKGKPCMEGRGLEKMANSLSYCF